MKSLVIRSTLFLFTLILNLVAEAHAAKSFYAGIGYQSQNVLGKITQSESGAKSVLGTAIYPVVFKYDLLVAKDLFFSPKLTYTLLSRSAIGGSGKVTEWHLMLPLGMNIKDGPWDWSAGPGVYNSKIAGSGGVVTLSNGNGTSQFALPGGTTETQLISVNAGTYYRAGKSSFGFDLMTTGTFSDKRTINLMVSYLYQFSGGR
jgi:hypothetical protein